MTRIEKSNKYYNPRTNKYYIVMSVSNDGDSSNQENINEQEVINYIMNNSSIVEFPDISDNNYVTKIELDDYINKINNLKILINNLYTLDNIPETLLYKKFTSNDKNKLQLIEPEANKYIHPNTHSANDIVTTQDKRFLSDLDYDKLKKIEDNANKYIHPQYHSAEMIQETVSKNFISFIEREQWNKKTSIDDVDDRIKLLVGLNPKILELLNLLNDKLNESELVQKLLLQLSNKVDKENNKQLSTENYTSEEKLKLQSIEFGLNKYIHPDTHHASMITGIEEYIQNNEFCKIAYDKRHDKLHALDDIFSHSGFKDVKENNIPIFTNNGLLKDSNKKLPTSDIVGLDDIQIIKNKNIENTIIGKETPSDGNFTNISGVFKTLSITDEEYFIDNNNCRGNIYFINNNCKIYLANVNQCIDGSNINIIIPSNNYFIEVFPDFYNRFIINQSILSYGQSLKLKNQIGRLDLIKDSINGWFVKGEGNWETE